METKDVISAGLNRRKPLDLSENPFSICSQVTLNSMTWARSRTLGLNW